MTTRLKKLHRRSETPMLSYGRSSWESHFQSEALVHLHHPSQRCSSSVNPSADAPALGTASLLMGLSFLKAYFRHKFLKSSPTQR